MSGEFTGRRRVFIVWVKRVSLRSRDWEPIACLTRPEATSEISKARKAGDMAFVRAYQKTRKRSSKDSAAETAAEFE